MPTIINGDGVVTAGGTASTQGKVVLAEQTGSGTNTVTIQAPATLAADLTFTMPTADGTNGQVLQTNGSGQLSFATVTTSPAGSTGQLQYNNAGAFGAVSSGTSGQVLQSAGAGTPPTWATPATGAMVFLGSVSASNSAQIDLFDYFSSTYDVYVIIGSDVAIPTSGWLSLRVRTGTTVQTGNSYSSWSRATPSAAFTSTSGLWGENGGTGSTLSFYMYISNPNSTTRVKNIYGYVAEGYTSAGTPNPFQGNFVATYFGDTNALTGIRLYSQAANITSGNFRIYGIKNS